MKLFGRMHIGLLLLSLINMLPSIEAEDSWGVFSIAVASAVLSFVYAKWRGRSRAPRPLLYLSILAATGYLGYEMFYPHEEATVHIIDLAHFIIFLSCVKYFDLQAHRDAGLIMIISFILMVISAFVTASPLFALACVIDVTFGVAWLIHFHTERELSAMASRRRSLVRTAPAVEVQARIHEAGDDLPRLGTKRTVATCSVILTAIAGIIFVSAPRGWRGGLFSRMHGLVPASVTGFGDSVELNNNTISEDDTTVMRVRFSRFGVPILDEAFEPYMRGMTFDRYFKGRWQRTPTVFPRTLTDVSMGEPVPTIDVRAMVDLDSLVQQEVWLDTVSDGSLFAMLPPVAITSPDIGRVHVDRKDVALEAALFSRKSAHYTVWSPIGPIPVIAEALRRSSYGPRDGESLIPKRVREFARTFVPEGVDPEDPGTHRGIANAIRNYLSSDLFEYTLSRGNEKVQGDPIANFLLESRKGHCEYFASAMTLICQSLDIPSRLVSGFQGGELNQVGGFYQFRRKHAHAWVEVWLPNQGWTVFDPTPASASASRRAPQGFWARANRLIEYLQFKWSTTVVSFDSRNRDELVAEFERWLNRFTELGGRPRSVLEFIKLLIWGPEFLVIWMRVLYWIVLLLIVVLVVLAFRVGWILSLMARESWPARRIMSKARVRPAEARFYDRLILLLANKGHIKPAHATPKEFAERLARANHDLTGVPEIIDWFYEAQYGGKPLSRQRGESVKRLLQQLREDAAFGAA